MKILFIRSGNNEKKIHVSDNQQKSLENLGHEIFLYKIIGKGLTGYFINIFKIRKYISSLQPDIIHAHYSFCGFAATLAFTGKPIVVSLMGSDVFNTHLHLRLFIKLFAFLSWNAVIVKSSQMKKRIRLQKALIISNGVNLEKFVQLDKDASMYKLGWSSGKKHILFSSDPSRPEKNFDLAKSSLDLLSEENIPFDIHLLKDIANEEMIFYYNAADVLLLTSNYEGSPNVIKEAMACNCPIVATNVGDINEIIGNTENCYIACFDKEDIAKKIKKILISEKRTNGRIFIQHLDSRLVAKKLLEVYKHVLN